MRRATRPAIWTTATTRPSGRSRWQGVALVVDARLVERGVEELAGPVGDARTRPAIGARFTWQSKTFMKTLIRVIGAGPRPSSAGGAAGPIIETTPSAGLTISPARTGVTRSGSRKK
jgi:hypothetical protein